MATEDANKEKEIEYNPLRVKTNENVPKMGYIITKENYQF